MPEIALNDAEREIRDILDGARDGEFKTVELLYETATEYLAKIPRAGGLQFEVMMRRAKFVLSKGMLDRATEVIEGVHRLCRNPDGTDDQKSKGSELLEIYAFKMRITVAKGDQLGMKELYNQTKNLTASVADPRIMSVIQESWGRMFGDENRWAEACPEMKNAFRAYQEAGDHEGAKRCLKYWAMSNMLSNESENPFDVREAKSFVTDTDVAQFVDLRMAFADNNVEKFNAASAAIMNMRDSFITSHLSAIVEEFQGRAIVQLVKSYRKITLNNLSQALNIPVDRAQRILVNLILDDTIFGKIDQVKGILVLSSGSGSGTSGARFAAVRDWVQTLGGVSENLKQPASPMPIFMY
jgi:hypothetical protein